MTSLGYVNVNRNEQTISILGIASILIRTNIIHRILYFLVRGCHDISHSFKNNFNIYLFFNKHDIFHGILSFSHNSLFHR